MLTSVADNDADLFDPGRDDFLDDDLQGRLLRPVDVDEALQRQASLVCPAAVITALWMCMAILRRIFVDSFPVGFCRARAASKSPPRPISLDRAVIYPKMTVCTGSFGRHSRVALLLAALRAPIAVCLS